jgi:hypothetical protein
MGEATYKAYEELEVEKYQFVATLDKRTSDICQELDGKVFDMKDRIVGVNASPMHPSCRSCEIPYIQDDYSTRFARDSKGKAIEIPSNMTYEEWKKAIDNNSLDEAIKAKEEANKKATEKASNKDKVVEKDPVKLLESKGVKVDKESFKKVDSRLYKENANQLNNLIDKYPKIQEYIKNNPFEFKAESMKDTTNGTCRTNLDANRIAIVINSKNFDGYKGLFDRAMDSMTKGWHCPKSEDKLTVGTLTHEFGHAIHNVLIREYNNNNQGFEAFKKRVIATKNTKKRSSLASNYTKDIISGFNKEIITIAKEIDPNVNTVISTYGGSSPQEFFAECFANYECGKPNALGKAMGIFLERNFK